MLDGVNLKNAANSPILMETGITKDFCPVTVKKKNILLKGSASQVIRYNVRDLSRFLIHQSGSSILSLV